MIVNGQSFLVFVIPFVSEQNLNVVFRIHRYSTVACPQGNGNALQLPRILRAYCMCDFAINLAQSMLVKYHARKLCFVELSETMDENVSQKFYQLMWALNL